MTLLTFLDYSGVIVFAITGCLVAARRQLDIIGFIWLAIVTGIGGGTARDLILGRPVFWIEQPFYLTLCFATAVLMFFVAHWPEKQIRLILWFDAIGLAVFSVIGTQIAATTGAPFLVCILMGVITATLGGIIRDLLAGEPTLLMRREIYVTAAALSSVTWLVLHSIGVPSAIGIWIAVIAGFALRAAGLQYRLQLPGYGWIANASQQPEIERRSKK